MHKRVLNKTAQASSSPVSDNNHFGHYLKIERMEQGLSLEEISRQTNIKLEHLQALEEGDRRKLPADVFNRGFIRLYAETLGLDPQEALDKYEKEWGFSNGMSGAKTFLSGNHLFETTSPLLDRQVLTFIGIVLLVASSFLAYKIFLPHYDVLPKLKNIFQPTTSQTIPENTSSAKEISQIAPSAAKKLTDIPDEDEKRVSLSEENDSEVPDIAIPVTTSAALDQKPILSLPPPQEDMEISEGLTEEVPIDEQSTIVTEIVESLVPPSEPSPSVENEPITKEPQRASPRTKNIPEQETSPNQEEEQQAQYTLKARFSERTWLRITLDDQKPAEYIFNPDESHTWNAETKIKLFLGNAGGVQLSLNDTPVTLKKKSGQTLKISFP